jgi:hypothetical protein
MSHTQFADAITGLGSSSGTPITLAYVKGEGNIKPPESVINKREQFENEFDETTEGIMKRLTDLEEKVKEKNMPRWVIQEIGVIKGWLKSNHPFMAKQFEKQMDKTVTEAKGEVEGYLNSVIRHYGIEAIRQQAPLIDEANMSKRLTKGETDAKST